MGGGFGGKETRSVFLSCVAALAAHVTQRYVTVGWARDRGCEFPFSATFFHHDSGFQSALPGDWLV